MTKPFTTEGWVSDEMLARYPLFSKRARRFAIRLHRELAESRPDVEVGLPGMGSDSTLTLSVCKEGPAGRRPTLGVWVGMHHSHSRRRFGIDYDYGLRHCHYYAGVLSHEYNWGNPRWIGEWTRARDAIDGIKEWLIPELYIPGP